MLLSLIVLVHYLKVELPDERVLLYRDCVEILTERWQQAKRLESGGSFEDEQELTLSQKTVLLREIAFVMQQSREPGSGQAFIPRTQVCRIIASKLPDLLGATIATDEGAQQAECLRRAEAWLENIRTQSGILVERGLDQSGEPLVSFSHLTFQEYLAAVAIKEVAAYQSLIWENLLNPAWREVVLLYVVLAENASPVIKGLISSPIQPDGLVLAGYCLAERIKRVDVDLQQHTLTRLKETFLVAPPEQIETILGALSSIDSQEVITFLLEHANDVVVERQLAVIRALGKVRQDHPDIQRVREALVDILDNTTAVDVVVSVRESLAAVGDPRFLGIEPVMVEVPEQSIDSIRPGISMVQFGEPDEEGLLTRLGLFQRNLEHWIYIRWRMICARKTGSYVERFRISQYPVTNMEYHRFIQDTGGSSPRTWREGLFPVKEATHPVTGISWQSAILYCRWLSRKSGKIYSLPTEWQWEIAAGGAQGFRYPWGMEFSPTKCNVEESGVDRATPVGSYIEGASPYGALDMSGNVWEMTKGFHFIFISFSFLFTLLLFILTIMHYDLSSMYKYGILLRVIVTTASFLLFLSYLVISIMTLRAFSPTGLENSFLPLLRGGSWQAPASQATCYCRLGLESILLTRTDGRVSVGFRVITASEGESIAEETGDGSTSP